MFVRSLTLLAVAATLSACEHEDPKDPTDTGEDPTAGELDPVEHPGGTIGDETWTAADYTLASSLTIENGTLVVEPCSIIRMPADAVITVSTGGAIEMRGTEACPITITSAAASPARGDWSGIEINNGSGNGNVLEHVVVEYAGGTGYGGIWLDAGAHLAMTDSTVRESSSMGLDLESGAELAAFTGNTLADNDGYAIELAPGEVGDLGAGTYGPNGEEGLLVHNGTVDADATWNDLGAPIVAEGGFAVVGAELTVAAGVELRVGTDGIVEAYDAGGLRLAGTADQPVTVRSSADVPSAGDWGGIWLHSTSAGSANVIEHAVIEHSGSGGFGSLWIDADASVAVTDTVVRDGEGHGVDMEEGGELRAFTGNTLTGNEDGAIVLYANEVDQLGAGTYEGVVEIASGAVDHDTTWSDLGVPFFVPSGFAVDTSGRSAHLTIGEGATLKLGSLARIDVARNAGLRLAGTAAAPVVLESSASTPAPGDWAEIDVHASSHSGENVFEHAILRHAGSDGYGALWLDADADIRLDSVTFEDNAGCDVYGLGIVDATDTVFSSCN